MKKLLLIFVANLFTSVCMAQVSIAEMEQLLLKDATWLSTAISIPLVSNSQVWTESLFPVNGVIQANGFRFETPDRPSNSRSDFVAYSNNQVLAYGRLFERPTFHEARIALILELMNSNIQVKMLAKIYRVQTNDVGDFSVVRIKHENVTSKITDDHSRIFFIRGAKAISLRGKDGENVNVQPIAKALDELLKNPPTKPTDKKPVSEVKK